MEFSVYQLYTELKMKRINFCYSGPIGQASIEGVGNTLRQNLQYDEASTVASLSVFSIFIEQVQNVLNYSAEKLSRLDDLENELRVGVVVIGREENDDYFVYCGNKVFNSDIARIKAKIDEIKDLSKDELKILYKERRKREPDEGSKGAGLGLIEMARKAGKPMDYLFTSIDETYSFFSIKVVVGRAS